MIPAHIGSSSIYLLCTSWFIKDIWQYTKSTSMTTAFGELRTIAASLVFFLLQHLQCSVDRKLITPIVLSLTCHSDRHIRCTRNWTTTHLESEQLHTASLKLEICGIYSALKLHVFSEGWRFSTNKLSGKVSQHSPDGTEKKA